MSDALTEFGDDPPLDPEMADAIRRAEEIASELGHGPLKEPWDPLVVRSRYAAERRWWNEDPPPLAEIRDATVPGPWGDIPVRLFRPDGTGDLPVIVYFHGGGWVVGDLDTHFRATSCLAAASGMAVLAVDYRMAPEVKYPAPLDDCVAVVRHVADNGASMGLDPGRLAVMGDSAGASLSIGTSLFLRDAGGSPVRSQVLVYGSYDKLADTPSRRRYGDGRYGLAADEMKWYGAQYLRDQHDATDPLVSALLANLAGLPPSHVYAAELDPLVDESVLLDKALRAAGVPGDCHVYPGTVHGFINATRVVKAARDMIDRAAAAIRQDLT